MKTFIKEKFIKEVLGTEFQKTPVKYIIENIYDYSPEKFETDDKYSLAMLFVHQLNRNEFNQNGLKFFIMSNLEGYAFGQFTTTELVNEIQSEMMKTLKEHATGVAKVVKI